MNNNNLNNSAKNNYSIEPGKKINPGCFVVILISLFIVICVLFTCLIYAFHKRWSDKYNSNVFDSCKSSISSLISSDKSDDSKISSTDNSEISKGNSSSVTSEKEIDYNSLSIEDYAKVCTNKTFGTQDLGSDGAFRKILYMHNNYTVYINIGTYRNREELNEGAVNASVELYKALYSIYPQKFGSTLFGVYVSGNYYDENGDMTESNEVMFSWFDKTTLKTLDINNLSSDNLQDVIYRYYQPYKGINIQRD